MSGLTLRLKEVRHKRDKFNQVMVHKLKAQWLSGLNLRLKDLFETYSTVRGKQTKRIPIKIQLLTRSHKKLSRSY
ncbi:hypothetical protein ACV7JQ_00845 [Globicatella sulfidifaciens]